MNSESGDGALERVEGLGDSQGQEIELLKFQDLVVGWEDGRGQRRREVGGERPRYKNKNKREKRLWAYETVGNLDFL